LIRTINRGLLALTRIGYPTGKIAWGIFLLTFAILYFFQPFGEVRHGLRLDGLLRTVSYAFSVAGTFYLLEQYLRPVLIKKTASLWLRALWLLSEALVIASVVFLCKNLFLGFVYFDFNQYLTVLFRVFSITFFFLILMILVLYVLGSRQQEGLTLRSQDTNPEFIHTDISAIRALTNEKNYTTIYYLSEGKLVSQVLRGSLSFFEDQLSFPLLRVHRSYIINLEQIEKISGNSQGRTISLKDIGMDFKVSRKYMSTFNQHWASLSH
jgi:hypothetical protein